MKRALLFIIGMGMVNCVSAMDQVKSRLRSATTNLSYGVSGSHGITFNVEQDDQEIETNDTKLWRAAGMGVVTGVALALCDDTFLRIAMLCSSIPATKVMSGRNEAKITPFVALITYALTKAIMHNS